MAESNPFTVLARHVKVARLRKRWTQAKLVERSRTSSQTVVVIESGKLSSSAVGRSDRRLDRFGRSVARILYVLGESDVAKWLEHTGLPHDDTFIESALATLGQSKSASDSVLEQLLTSDDLDFLSRMQKEFTQPMTIGFAVELLKYRKGSSE